MLGKNYHVKKDQCLLAHLKILSYWQAGIEKSLWKLLGSDSCPAQNFWASHLQGSYSLPLELERLNWLSKGAKALAQISQRTGEQEAGAEGASPPAGAGFVTLQLLLPQSGVPTSADNPTQDAKCHRATRTLSWRAVCKREFLICGKLQHSEICFSSAYKQEAKIPWSVWNGSPGEEQGQGMKKIKKPPFEEKKNPVDTVLVNFATFWLSWGPNQTPAAAHRESGRDAWKTSKQWSRSYFQIGYTQIQYLQRAIQLLTESNKTFWYRFQFQNMCPYRKYLLKHVQLVECQFNFFLD